MLLEKVRKALLNEWVGSSIFVGTLFTVTFLVPFVLLRRLGTVNPSWMMSLGLVALAMATGVLIGLAWRALTPDRYRLSRMTMALPGAAIGGISSVMAALVWLLTRA